MAVFTIDLALHTLQPFTNDVALIKTALARAATQGNTGFASEREEARERTAAVDRADATLGGLSGDPGSANAASLVAPSRPFDQVQVNMIRTFDALERDQQGYATTNGLLAVVNGLKAIPGRKTVVFFSEGLAITANVQAQFRSVISSANRANVSVYAIDAGGLRMESGNQGGGARSSARRRGAGPIRRQRRLAQLGRRPDPRPRAQRGPTCASTRRAASASSPTRPAASWCATPTTRRPGSAASRRTCASTTSLSYTPTNTVLRRALPHDRGQGGAARA